MTRYSIILSAVLTAAIAPFAAAQYGRPGGHPGYHGGPHPIQPGVGGYWPRAVVTINPWYPFYGYGYPYYRSYGYPFSYYGYSYPSYGYGYPYAAPVTIPAESLYGIGPVQRLMGVDTGSNPPVRVARPVIEPPAPATPPSDSAETRQKADDAQAALADRYLEMGDVQFAAGKYVTAIERYRRATTAAPRDAKGQFRLAFAFLATEQYDLAAKAIRKGLKLDPTWPRCGFRLAELYGDDDRAKASHLEVLAQEAEDHPEKADLLFLIGVFLHSDGQAERAGPFFTRAAQLEQIDRTPIDAFLKKG